MTVCDEVGMCNNETLHSWLLPAVVSEGGLWHCLLHLFLNQEEIHFMYPFLLGFLVHGD